VTALIPILSMLAVGFWLGVAFGARWKGVPPRSAVYRFSTGQECAAAYLFEWLAITPVESWPPMQDVLAAARSVGQSFTAPEVERLVTAVRPMAQRAVQRGHQALTGHGALTGRRG